MLLSFSSLISTQSSLFVRDVSGTYRTADTREVLQAAQQILAAQVIGREVLDSPIVAQDFLRTMLGTLEHEVFALLMLDVKHRVLDYVELFRGTLTQTSVYPREAVKEALARNAAAVILVHNHPSGSAEPSLADQFLTTTLQTAFRLFDIRVLDHMIVTATEVVSFEKRGLLL